MKRITKKWKTAIFCMALCGTLAACGSKNKVREPEESGTAGVSTEAAEAESVPQQESGAAQAGENGGEADRYSLIESQTFEVTLKPQGKVTFASYQPDGGNLYEDALFKLMDGERTIATLDGMVQDNRRENENFNEVEAVSFPDYNNDGYSDIIIICSYSPASGASGRFSEARIYRGSGNGSFTLERELSDSANSALAEKTVKSVLGFLGAGKKEEQELAAWQQAYLSHLQQETGQWQGYNLIYINDDAVPELVEIGGSEAAGCGIVSFADGAVSETQLDRLGFTYIEKGNLLCNSDGHMDSYYDLVYSMAGGRLTQIAAGYYGAEDPSNLQLDENGEPVYRYEWNGAVMSKEEYYQALNAVYDTSKAKDGYQWDKWLTKEDVIRAITE